MAGNSCCVINCNSKSHSRSGKKLNNGIRFFSFPKCNVKQGTHVEEVTRRCRMAWMAATRLNPLSCNNISESMKVCSLHFKSGQPAYEMLDTHPDWAPNLRLGHNKLKATDKNRLERLRHRGSGVRTGEKLENKIQSEADEEPQEDKENKEIEMSPHDVQEMVQQEDDLAENPCECGTEECELCLSSHDEINHLLQENCQLTHELDQFKITEAFLQDDDARVEYYTGLPNYRVFQVLLCHVTPFLPQESKLTPFQMILLTFMRLRLDLPIQHIAHLFGVQQATVCIVFQATVNVLYIRFSPLVLWPDRKCVQVTMPNQFVETFGNQVATILDSFDVPLEIPSNLKAKLQRFSKNRHNTLRYLISITPQGVISFASEGWGGRTSGRRITENCGLLDKLLPGDTVLVNREFDTQDAVGLMCPKMKMLAFTKGQLQLEAMDVEEMRSIAHLSSHVEKLNGLVRDKYKILSSPIPISMVLPCEDDNVTLLDKIVKVCCALTNMCPSVVL